MRRQAKGKINEAPIKKTLSVLVKKIKTEFPSVEKVVFLDKKTAIRISSGCNSENGLYIKISLLELKNHKHTVTISSREEETGIVLHQSRITTISHLKNFLAKLKILQKGVLYAKTVKENLYESHNLNLWSYGGKITVYTIKDRVFLEIGSCHQKFTFKVGKTQAFLTSLVNISSDQINALETLLKEENKTTWIADINSKTLSFFKI